MKKAIVFTIALAILSGSAFLVSCNKEKYRGPQGEPGIQGPKGERGDSATSPDLIKNMAVIVSAEQWIPDEDHGWTSVVPAGIITQEVIDQGAVQVYVRKNEVWHHLPYLDHTTFTTFAFELGKVHLLLGDSHGSEPAKPVTESYRITVITETH